MCIWKGKINRFIHNQEEYYQTHESGKLIQSDNLDNTGNEQIYVLEEKTFAHITIIIELFKAQYILFVYLTYYLYCLHRNLHLRVLSTVILDIMEQLNILIRCNNVF